MRTSWVRWLDFSSDNPKSPIQNPKWLGLSVIVFVLLVTGVVARAQQPEKIRRIGFLLASSTSSQEPRLQAFTQGLRELGYVIGKNIAIEIRSGEGKADQLVAEANELARLKVEVIVSGGPTSTRAARKATSTIPIVVTLEGDPVGDGLVESLARPGGNITGLSTLSQELGGKRLELLKEIVPRLSRVAVFYSIGQRNAAQENEVDTAARVLGLELKKFKLRDSNDIESVFQAAVKERAGAVLAQAMAVLLSHRRRVAETAIHRQLPTMFAREEFVDAGGLVHYAASTSDLSRRAATYVDKILKGAKPADLPIEQPTKFELVINLKTAKQIGVTIPPNVLARADRVIK
jgi:putative ABC transport system substrate-binding protein